MAPGRTGHFSDRHAACASARSCTRGRTYPSVQRPGWKIQVCKAARVSVLQAPYRVRKV